MIFRAVTSVVILMLTAVNSFDSQADKVRAGEDLVKVEVATLLPNEQQGNVLLVLRPDQKGGRDDKAGEVEARRVLPLVIGIEEARSIYMIFSKLAAPRPLSHDLMKRIIEEYGGSVVSCVITKMERATFFAELRLKRDGREFVVDCRPSDAIALALRANAPVLVRRSVLIEHSVDPAKPELPEKTLKT